MGVVNKKLNNNFTQISNVCYYDKRLNYFELGLYSQLCSFPDNWKVSIRRLDRLHSVDNKSHRNMISKALNGLICYGYMYRIKPEKMFNDNGKFENYDYELYSSPFDNPHIKENEVPEDLKKIYMEQFMNIRYQSTVTCGDSSASPHKTATVPIGDTINTNLINKNINIVVDEKRFKDAVYIEKLRCDEAYGTDEHSNKAIQYAINSFNCFGESQILKINQLSKKQYISLFVLACDFANEEGQYNEVSNHKKVFSTMIKSYTRNLNA